ncbi:NADH-quinone oxidoreductase subunit C [Thiolapillus sp.]
MSKELTRWMDDLLQEIDTLRFERKNERRVRVDVDSKSVHSLLELLRGRASFVHLSAISCVDWIDEGEFELVYHIWSYEMNTLVSVHTRISRDSCSYISVYDIFPNCAFYERDIHEMYGMYFEGSPCMDKFILTEWEGPPPMRKDFDSEAWVNEHFDWQDYHPDWLQELETQGGGIAIHPDEQRFSRRDKE